MINHGCVVSNMHESELPVSHLKLTWGRLHLWEISSIGESNLLKACINVYAVNGSTSFTAELFQLPAATVPLNARSSSCLWHLIYFLPVLTSWLLHISNPHDSPCWRTDRVLLAILRRKYMLLSSFLPPIYLSNIASKSLMLQWRCNFIRWLLKF